MPTVKQQGSRAGRRVKRGEQLTAERDIRLLLQTAATIAVVGLSPKPDRDSHCMAAYIQRQGYRIIPVRSAQREILGEKAYGSLREISERVDLVNAFVNSARIMPHARDAVALAPRAFWMQTGIENPEAAEMLRKAGIDVIMNRCIGVAHARLCK
ncbi:MAG: CoA-binding protein [Desulfobacterales bacterium]|jgi:predicted CoA-binding protein